MALDPTQVATAVATGVALFVGKLVEILGKRKRLRNQSRQLDRMEAKVDELVEDARETQHRLARLEERVGLPRIERQRVNGMPR